MSVEDELKKGNFVLGECTNCKKTIWPPADYCNVCFGRVSIKKGPSKGKIIEFSKHDESYFCLVEFEKNVRIIGNISSIPKIDQMITIKKCGVRKGNYFFEFSQI